MKLWISLWARCFPNMRAASAKLLRTAQFVQRNTTHVQ